MCAQPSCNIDTLQRTIGYSFTNTAVLMQALTHRSYGKNHYERLEFLGDSLVNCIAADMLYKKFSNVPEGQLSRLRSSIVKGTTLAQVAQELKLAEYIHMGVGEQKSGGRSRQSILADVVESVIAAIYIDSDFPTVYRVVSRWMELRISNIDVSKTMKDPKSILQEKLQADGRQLPHYEVIDTAGAAHAMQFVVRCTVRVTGTPMYAEGTGSSRRFAEQQAAEHMLQTYSS